MTVKPPYRGLNMKKIKYVISESADAKELRPFNRAGVPILSPETVPDFIIKVRLLLFSTKACRWQEIARIKYKQHGLGWLTSGALRDYGVWGQIPLNA